MVLQSDALSHLFMLFAKILQAMLVAACLLDYTTYKTEATNLRKLSCSRQPPNNLNNNLKYDPDCCVHVFGFIVKTHGCQAAPHETDTVRNATRVFSDCFLG